MFRIESGIILGLESLFVTITKELFSIIWDDIRVKFVVTQKEIEIIW